MFFEVNFTGLSYRVTGAALPPEEFIFDLGLQASTLTLVARCLEITKTSPGPLLYLDLQTSMDLREGKWFSLGSFTPLTKADDFDKRDFTGLLRWVRWEVMGLTNASSATFQIFGVAR